MYHKQENCLDTCFLQLMFLLRGLFLFIIQQSLFIISHVRVHSGRFLSYSKKRKIKMTTRCHSLSFVVTHCHLLSLVVILITRCHSFHLLSLVVPLAVGRCYSLSLAVPLAVIRCHSLYHSLSFVALVVTRCINRLSFYKRS